MNLSELKKYKHVTIQCHDIPDADAICSGLALGGYFEELGAEVSLVYGGVAPITKPSLVMLLEMLEIKITRITALPPEMELLITVDCQRGAGNVQHFELPEGADFMVIDHHRPEIMEDDRVIIRPHLSSCATLVWDLLRNVGFELDSRLMNALYYGLFTDTNGLSELRHPLDRDLADMPHDAGMIRKLKNAAITIEELDIIGGALRGREVVGRIGLFRAQDCDANLLGFTSDIAQQVAHLDCCVVYCRQKHGLKLSVRSSAREIMASEIASFLCREVGSGGGNIEKAGGFMSFAKISENSGGIEPEDYLVSRVSEYLGNYEMISAGENDIAFGEMPLYKKLPRPIGFAQSADIFPHGARITIRTLEGDVDMATGDEIYIMIGIQGEVYPIKRERFEASYDVLPYPYVEKAEYIPSVINRFSGERREILPYAKTCMPKDNKVVRAVPLQKDAKVFTFWDTEKYFYGGVGDYLVANEDNYDDCYIVRKDIFEESYEPFSPIL